MWPYIFSFSSFSIFHLCQNYLISVLEATIHNLKNFALLSEICASCEFFENTDWWVKVHKQDGQIIGKQIWGGVKSNIFGCSFTHAYFIHRFIESIQSRFPSPLKKFRVSFYCVHNWFDLPRVAVWKGRWEAFYGLKYWVSEYKNNHILFY